MCHSNYQEKIYRYMELCSMLYGSLDGRGVWGRMDTCVYMAESFCRSPETITSLLIGYTPIQHKKFSFLKRKRSTEDTQKEVRRKLKCFTTKQSTKCKDGSNGGNEGPENL